MKLPAFLLLKPVQYGIGIVALVGAVALWFNRHDAKVRDQALAAERDRRYQEAVDASKARADSLQVELDSAIADTDTVRVYLASAAASYARQRSGISTTAPQPAGVPAGSVVVPIAFVESADSLARMVPVLLATIEVERVASQRRIMAGDSTIRLLETQNAQLRIAIEAAKPGISDRIKWAGYGGAAVALGMLVLGNR